MGGFSLWPNFNINPKSSYTCNFVFILFGYRLFFPLINTAAQDCIVPVSNMLLLYLQNLRSCVRQDFSYHLCNSTLASDRLIWTEWLGFEMEFGFELDCSRNCSVQWVMVIVLRCNLCLQFLKLLIELCLWVCLVYVSYHHLCIVDIHIMLILLLFNQINPIQTQFSDQERYNAI